jgi:hypothetical protein
MEENNFKPIEIKDFIKQLVEQIEDAVDLELRSIVSNIDIEISVEKVINKEGKLQMYVAPGKFDGTKKGQTATVKFSVSPKESERSKQMTREAIRHNTEQSEKWKNSF